MIASTKIESIEKLIEVRPGRRLNIYHHKVGDEKDKDDSRTTAFFIHGSMATLKQFSGTIEFLQEKLPVNVRSYHFLLL